MPLVGEFHGKYWARGSTAASPVFGAGKPGYPAWQASVISSVVFGPPLDLLKAVWARMRFALSLFRRGWDWPASQRDELRQVLDHYARCDRERRAVVQRTLQVVASPVYALARQAVRRTATTVGFRDSEAALQLHRSMKVNAGRRDNVLRHLHAWDQVNATARAAGSTLTNPQLHFVTELGYVGFTLNPRG